MDFLDINNWGSIAIYFVAFLLIFYLLIIMPRKRQEKKQKELLSSLTPGDRVITIGGVKGIISQVNDDDDSVIIKTAAGTEIEFIRKAIAFKENEEK